MASKAPAKKSPICEVFLVRHAHSTANLKGLLAGRNNQVGLSERGKLEALRLAHYLEGFTFDAIYSSPLKRCIDTISPYLAATGQKALMREDLLEMEYGSWSGQPLKILSKDPLWKSIQERPSTVRFPRGESFSEMSLRANQGVLSASNSKERILILSHGDVIKSILAFHLGMSLDTFQRISVDPASVSIIRLPMSHVTLMNSTTHLSAPKESKGPSVGKSNKRDQFTLGGGQGKL